MVMLERDGEKPMRRTGFWLAGTLSLCLVVALGLAGCGDETDEVTIDLELACSQSLGDFNSDGCRGTAYDRVDVLKACVMDCGTQDEVCLEDCLDAWRTPSGECTGDVQFLFTEACGICPYNCAAEFVGEDPDSGCLNDPAQSGEDCLDALYVCVNDDC